MIFVLASFLDFLRHHVTQADLQLVILMPLSPERWDCMWAPPYLAPSVYMLIDFYVLNHPPVSGIRST
jgi:hypothetical protein